MSKHLPPKKNKHEASEGKSLFNTPLRERRNSHAKNELNETGKKNLLFIVPAALFFALGLILPVKGWVEIAIFALSMVLAGFQVIIRASDEAMSLKLLESDFLILIACLASFALGSYSASAAMMLSYRIIRLVEGHSQQDTQNLKSEAFSFRPQLARIINDGVNLETEPERVAEDDILEVRPGEIFPVDGYVIDGVSAMDASPLTGSGPVRSISVGSPVWSGCINSSGLIKMKAERIYAESAVCRIIEILERSEKYKSKLEKLAMKIERYFTPALVVLALVLALVPPIFSGQWTMWLGRGAVLFAVSACSSLAITLGQCMSRASVWAAKRGIIFKGNCFFETLGAAQTFVFNKTGTLTEGRYVVSEVVPVGMSINEFLNLAAQVESVSEHPIARAVCWASGAAAGAGLEIKAEEYEGRGIEAIVNGTELILGNAMLLAEHDIDCPVTPRGSSAVHMAVNGKYAGYMLLVDKIRENAFDQLEGLRIRGVRNMVTLTADMRSVARPLASSLNMDMVRAELSSEAKVSALEYLMATKAEHSTLAFVCNGDGDPEALRRADAGLSFGALGHYDAFELADVLILEDRLSALAEAVGISKQVCRTELISLAVFMLVKLGIIVLTLSGIAGLTVAATAELLMNILLCALSLKISNYDNITGRKTR